MSSLPEIGHLLAEQGFIVAYSPLRTEVDWRLYAGLPPAIPTRIIPPRASLDPSTEAWKVRSEAGDRDVAILIPGREFDASGTRHGQGGGWYDRFLATVPREWLRIGFCYRDQFSETPIPRMPHDQSMDYVVVVNRETGEVALYSSEGVPT